MTVVQNDNVGDREREFVTLFVLLVVDVTVTVEEGDRENVAVPDLDVVAEPVVECVMDGAADVVCSIEGEELTVDVGVLLFVIETSAVYDMVDEVVAVADEDETTEAVEKAEPEKDNVIVPHEDAVGELFELPVGEEVALSEPENNPERVGELVDDALDEKFVDAVFETVEVADDEAAPEVVTERVTDIVDEADRVTEPDAQDVKLPDVEGETVTLPELHADVVDDDDATPEVVGVKVDEEDNVADTVALDEPVRTEVADTVYDPEAELLGEPV